MEHEKLIKTLIEANKHLGDSDWMKKELKKFKLEVATEKIDFKQVEKIAEKIKTFDEIKPFNFYEESHKLYPAINEANPSMTISYFLGTQSHQFGFWYDDGNKYLKPMTGIINGKEFRGSDYLMASSMRALKEDPDFFLPARMSTMELSDVKHWFRDDDGNVPMPQLEDHLRLAKGYGQKLVDDGLAPDELVYMANAEEKPLKTFLELLDTIPGYMEDSLRKKSMLVSVVLSNRSEHFLEIKDSENLKPIVDYHLMRLALRTGMVKVYQHVEEELKDRVFMADTEVDSIRLATYLVFEKLSELSGKDIPTVDSFAWSARHYCPQMEIPDCNSGACGLEDICERNYGLFQPIIRTTFY